MPDRIQLRRTKGWKLPEGAVSVARTPYHGLLQVGGYVRGGGMDPYEVKVVQSREQAVALFIDWLKHEPSMKVEYLAGKDLVAGAPA